MDIELGEVMGCTCLRLRRVTRRITQIYDHALAESGITVNQFGLLTHLHGARLHGLAGFSMGTLAERLGADPTTLNRTLKPLEKKGWVKDAADPGDSRVRLVGITDRGRRALSAAMPLWRKAQAQVAEALGPQATAALGELLDQAAARLADVA
jgi:DNA-binding MarR family transcriptional regulator